MAVIKLYNLAAMTTATTGTGTITLGSAATVNGVLYLSFAAAGVSDAEVVMYSIADTNNSEVGYGTYTSAGTTLTRNVLRSTNSNNAISLSGSAIVRISALAENFMLGSILPQGRLTLTSGTPVMTSDVTAATTIYYTPSNGNLCPIYNGAFFVNTAFSQLSQATTDNTKSPAAVANNSNYDMFVWNDSGTIRCTRGPAWSSDTSRGSGAGTTELTLVNGMYLNANAITNGPGASRGTYVGSVRSNGSAQIDWMVLPAAAAGGSANLLGVWNAYNRVNVRSICRDSTDSWSYSTATIRAANNSTSNRISFIVGLQESCFLNSMYLVLTGNSTAGANGYVGVGIDTTSAFTNNLIGFNSTQFAITVAGYYIGPVSSVGFHYAQALERGDTTTTTTWYGDNGNAAIYQSGLSLILDM